jgi:hypothetical protein
MLDCNLTLHPFRARTVAFDQLAAERLCTFVLQMQACRRGESAIAVEAVMDNVG